MIFEKHRLTENTRFSEVELAVKERFDVMHLDGYTARFKLGKIEMWMRNHDI